MGVGKTKPNPAESLFLEDKLEVPLGKPIMSNVDDSTLLYNEYPFILFFLDKKNCIFIISELMSFTYVVNI